MPEHRVLLLSRNLLSLAVYIPCFSGSYSLIMNGVSSFLSQLASYYWQENDLSNVTVALCNSCAEFRGLFLKYFFPSINVDDVDEIVREKPDDNDQGSRVDIFVRMKTDELPYLIEVKINDKKQHFNQYLDSYNIHPSRLGYIVNYYLKKPGFDVKSWEDIYNYLLSSLERVSTEVKPLFNGYIQYLQSVCQIVTYTKPMNLDGIYSLYEFSNIAWNALRINAETYDCEPNKQYQPMRSKILFGIHAIDFFISYKDKKRSKIYGWLSLYFYKEQPELYIAISEQHNKNAHPTLFGNAKLAEGKHYSNPFEEYDEVWNINCLWFQFKDIQIFNESKTIMEQKNLLTNFITEVFDFVTIH